MDSILLVIFNCGHSSRHFSADQRVPTGKARVEAAHLSKALPWPPVVYMQRQSSAPNLQLIHKLPKLLTSRTVSEMLSVPEGTLRYWRKVGIGPKWLKLEGSIRYDLADVLAYIERGRRTPSVRANMEEMRESL